METAVEDDRIASPELAAARARMVEWQLVRRGVRDRRVLDAMRQVPREAFVQPGYEEFAYEDGALPIEAGQTISQPYIVALMIEAAELTPDDSVLEIGAGSAYAAAVMSRIAHRVYAIERHQVLAQSAQRRFEALGYANIQTRVGDGTRGWPEAAPFDAIVVSAGGPAVPRALKEQLAIGGRLVIPVGERHRQNLMKITRRDQTHYEEDDLGPVAFVPLIGEHGWAEDGRRAASNHVPGSARKRTVPQLIAEAAEALPDFSDSAFGRLFDRFADRRVVLLGEASHGTSEFYRARTAITRRLVEQHGFTIVAVEADWPDAASADRYVRHRPASEAAEPAFQRFPTWMWRNTDVVELVEVLRTHNEGKAEARTARRLLWARSVQHERLDRCGSRVSGRNGPCGRRGGARAVRMPDTLAARSGNVWACRAQCRISQVRAGSGCAVPRPAREASSVCRPGRRSFSGCCTERAPDRVGRALLPDHVLRGAESWNLRDTHVRDARASAGSTAHARRRWCGHTTRISAMRASPRWARCAAS